MLLELGSKGSCHISDVTFFTVHAVDSVHNSAFLLLGCRVFWVNQLFESGYQLPAIYRDILSCDPHHFKSHDKTSYTVEALVSNHRGNSEKWSQLGLVASEDGLL